VLGQLVTRDVAKYKSCWKRRSDSPRRSE
jgi:hypothetical protein